MDTIVLDVGGELFETLPSTLEKSPILFRMAKEYQNTPPDKRKPIFLDHDPIVFWSFLNALRGYNEPHTIFLQDLYQQYEIPVNYPHLVRPEGPSPLDDATLQKDEIVTLNVGGTLFKTYVSTLLTCDYFKALIARWCVDGKQTIFLDRDPKRFRRLLLNIRHQSLVFATRDDMEEADFLGLDMDISDKTPDSSEYLS